MIPSFPRSLEPHRRWIESTATQTVLLSLKEEKTLLHQSKIGGLPYFPIDRPPETFYLPHPRTMNVSPWPKQSMTGVELTLLLQLDFAAMPPLPSFPKEGMLQLFVDENDWHDLEGQLRVVYHPYVITDQARLFSDYDFDPGDLRVRERSISFAKETEFMTSSDFRFDRSLDRAISRDSGASKAYIALTDQRHTGREEIGYGRNKIGGYHYSQNGQDPRASRPDWADSVLLVQFQNYGDLSWGDGGSAQFFIKRRDIERCRFDDLLFHWDST